MSMLRRPHDHHRDLPARRDATPSANRSNDQDRYFMTAPVPRCRKCACFVRWFSAGSDRARPNIRLSVKPHNCPHSSAHPAAHSKPASPPVDTPDRLILNHAQHSRHSNPHSAPRTTLVSLPRGFLPWRFSDAGRPRARHPPSAAGIRKPSQQRSFGCWFVRSLSPVGIAAHPPRHRNANLIPAT
jgi:hypothetical protein